METATSTIVRWAVSLLILMLVVGLLFWIVTNPAAASGFIVSIIGGMARFATGLIDGIAGIFT